jgi:dTDP-4-dehydrorhamnose reductase
MKILIFGAQGWIGKMLIDEWARIHPEDEIVASSLRVQADNSVKLREQIEGCDRVICCIGRTSGTLADGTFVNTIDYCETNLCENLRDNFVAPMLLAMLCEQTGKHLLYIGTGCIFSWDTNANTERQVMEEEYPDFFGSAYSVVKGQTDSLIREYKNVCNCRIRMPVSNRNHPRNFISKIVGYSKIHNTNNSMTYLPNFLPIIIEMSKNCATGTYNCTNPGYTNHSECLKLYREKINGSHDFELVTTPETLQLKSKRSSNILSTDKIQAWCQERNIVLMNMQEALEDCFNKWE